MDCFVASLTTIYIIIVLEFSPIVFWKGRRPLRGDAAITTASYCRDRTSQNRERIRRETGTVLCLFFRRIPSASSYTFRSLASLRLYRTRECPCHTLCLGNVRSRSRRSTSSCRPLQRGDDTNEPIRERLYLRQSRNATPNGSRVSVRRSRCV